MIYVKEDNVDPLSGKFALYNSCDFQNSFDTFQCEIIFSEEIASGK